MMRAACAEAQLVRQLIGGCLQFSPPAMPCCQPQTDASASLSACVGAGMDEGLGAAPRYQKVAW